MTKGGYREGAGRPKGTKKEPTVTYYRRVKPQWVEILDKKLEKLKGLEKMKNLTKDDIIYMLADYVAGIAVDFEQFGELEDKISEQFALYNREWEALPCDDEGFNASQQEEANKLDDEYSTTILNIINS